MRMNLNWRDGLLLAVVVSNGLLLLAGQPVHPVNILVTLLVSLWLFVDNLMCSNQRAGFSLLTLLRRSFLLYVIVGVVLGFILIWLWILSYQPAAGKPLLPEEWMYLISALIAIVFGYFGGLTTEQVRRASVPSGAAGAVISLVTIAILITGVELGLRYLLVMSDNFAFSKMHRNWVNVYWNPINAHDYRDFDVAPDDSTNLLVMGDSLAAGYGVNRIEDTFPHMIGALRNEYHVNVVAQPGWGVATALGAVQQYPVEPDVLLMSHFTNDILEGPAGRLYERAFPQIRRQPPENLTWWIENLDLANFLYYRLYHYAAAHDASGQYTSHILDAYEDADVWSAYQAELQQVVDWTDERNIPLIVAVWPNLVDVEGSAESVEKVVSWFDDRGVTVVDLSPVLAQIPVGQRVVNRYDAHPSVTSHRAAAEAIAPLLP